MLYYDRNQVIDWIKEISLRPCDFSRPEDYDDNKTEDLANCALDILEEPIKHRPYAEWIEDSDPGETIGAHWKCSECNVCFGEREPWNPIQCKWHYCPSCGAEMKRTNFA